MADENQSDKQRGGESSEGAQGGNSVQQSGDPGRTPGKAEGDEETVEESLRQQDAKRH